MKSRTPAKVTPRWMKEIQKSKSRNSKIELGDLEGAYVAADVIDTNTGEVLLEANQELTADKMSKMIDAGIAEVERILPRARRRGHRDQRNPAPRFRQDSARSLDRNLPQAASRRSADPRHRDRVVPRQVVRPRKYDFSRVGRLKFNIKLFDKQDARGSRQAHPRSG